MGLKFKLDPKAKIKISASCGGSEPCKAGCSTHPRTKDGMRLITIAFDVDGTLRNNTDDTMVANERIRSLLVALSSFKNVKIVVWSGGGELYARQAARAMHVDQYVDEYASKNFVRKDGLKPIFEPDIKPDIAIDDIHDCELGIINLIVKEK